MNKKVKCRSGLMGWRGRLQDQYSSWDEFKNCAIIWGLVKRLGYNTEREAWEDNPVVEGSVNPSDYRRVAFETRDAVIGELERIGFVATDPCNTVRNRLQSSDLIARVIEYATGMRNIEIYFAEKRTFDTSGNSSNFIVRIDANNPYVDIEKAVKHARKICKAKVFDFNTYFHTIDLT